MASVIIGIIAAGIIFLAARQIYKDKKKGRPLCGGKCSCCGCACSGEMKRSEGNDSIRTKKAGGGL